MTDVFSPQQPIPAELLGSLVDSTACLSDALRLRQSFAESGYVFLREVLDRAEVFSARIEVFERLAQVGEIQAPAAEGIATGASRRRELVGDLGAFWKSVSEGPLLRRVTHGWRLRELVSLVFDASARPHDYLFVRPAPVGNGTDLHYDYPFFAGRASQIVTCWVPLGEIPISDGPLVVVEGSHRLIGAIELMRLTGDPRTFAATRDAAYQSTARGARLLTAHFQPGDVIVFSGFTMHGSLDNHSPAGRVRLSVDVRYQPATDPADDTRYFGPNPVGPKGGAYGEQKAAQPLGTLWTAQW
ncbi:MAG: phytanoyl-CoA dioxygenase family protein [Deltaproteobacteria bacterium]|nr:phytanoyl-CoA dioxygenase family protein [Deltaproteobacteria bacterium]